MKSFCLLEQGNLVGDLLTAQKKKMFTTDFSDFYRLNWQRSDDPDAFICAQNVVWSEGRSLLYEKVPKSYEYYVFIDDDISFHSPSSSDKEIPVLIKSFFEKYKPLAGTFLHSYGKDKNWHLEGGEREEAYLEKEAFPIAGYDLCLHFFSSSFADVMFPIPYHGSGQSMWYAQWACYKLYPLKQLCFTKVNIRNTRSEPHRDFEKNHNIKTRYMVELFNADTLEHDFNWSYREIVRANKSLMAREVDPSKVTFTYSDLARIYNIRNPAFLSRASLAPAHLPFTLKWKMLQIFLLKGFRILLNKIVSMGLGSRPQVRHR